MSSFYILLASALIAVPQSSDQRFATQDISTFSQVVASLRTGHNDAKNKKGREIVLEVPGITCVSRFKDSLRQHIVDKLDGVNGVTFSYLPRDQEHPFDDKLKKTIKDGKMFFGGWGRLAFQVDAEFDDRILLRKLLKSKLYTNTDMWLLIQRRPLSELNLVE